MNKEVAIKREGSMVQRCIKNILPFVIITLDATLFAQDAHIEKASEKDEPPPGYNHRAAEVNGAHTKIGENRVDIITHRENPKIVSVARLLIDGRFVQITALPGVTTVESRSNYGDFFDSYLTVQAKDGDKLLPGFSNVTIRHIDSKPQLP